MHREAYHLRPSLIPYIDRADRKVLARPVNLMADFKALIAAKQIFRPIDVRLAVVLSPPPPRSSGTSLEGHSLKQLPRVMEMDRKPTLRALIEVPLLSPQPRSFLEPQFTRLAIQRPPH